MKVIKMKQEVKKVAVNHHGLIITHITKRIFLFIVSVILCFFAANAQKPGKLTGKIRDAANNEPLNGVSITIKNIKQGTTSITDGTYSLTLPAGLYTLRFSITGYQAKEITDITVKSDETAFLDILLEVATKQLKDVVIIAPAKKESTAAVYSLQKRSAAASDAISQETINRTPDNNSGQVLRRVTGVNVSDNKFVVVRGLAEQYNQTVLNGVPMTSTEGNKNAFAFDLIPAAAIDNIVVNKTATPDMPGNFAGGIVQVNTKDFPAKNFLTLSLQLGFSDQTYGRDFYSDERAPLQWLGFDGGIRNLPAGFPTNTSRVPFVFLNKTEQTRYLSRLPNNLVPINYGPAGFNEQVQIGFGKNINFKNQNQFGLVASLNRRRITLIEQDLNMRSPQIGPEFFENEQVRKFYTNPPDPAQPEAAVINTFSDNLRYRYAVDLGGVINLSYRFGTNKITLKNLFTHVYNNQYINRGFIFQQGALAGIAAPSDYQQFGYVYNSSSKLLLNSTLGGEHRTGKGNETRIDWNTTVTVNQTNLPDTRNFVFGTDSLKNFIAINTNLRNIRDFLSQASRTWNKLEDFIFTTGFNITTPFNIKNRKQLFKTGFLTQSRSRQNRAAVIPFSDVNGTPATVLSADDIINGRTNISQGITGLADEGGDYNAGSSLIAVYESVENKIWEKFRLIWGLRFEKYQQSANIFNAVYYNGFTGPEPIVRNFASRTEFNLLPSVNAIYSPVSSVNIRAAFSATVIRPDLKDIVGIPTFDVTNFRLTYGNPELRSTSVTNYDLKFEWFPSAGEIMSASFFYKDILNPIEYVIPFNQVQYPDVSGVPVNTGKAFVRGIELEIRKKIDFIDVLPFLKNVTLFGNSTILQSKVFEQQLQSIIIPRVAEHRLTGQPNLIINAGINILAFKNSLDFTFTFNRSGDYIGELGSFDKFVIDNDSRFPGVTYTREQRVPNLFVRRRNLLDFVISKSFYKNKAKVKLNIGNILREPFILYQDLNNNKRFDTPLVIASGPNKIGSSYNVPNPGLYRGGIDNTATRLTGQRLYEFTLSYTF